MTYNAGIWQNSYCLAIMGDRLGESFPIQSSTVRHAGGYVRFMPCTNGHDEVCGTVSMIRFRIQEKEGSQGRASGYRERTTGSLANMGSNGYAWSFAANSAANAYNLNFNSGNVNPLNNNNRANGFPVRPCRVSGTPALYFIINNMKRYSRDEIHRLVTRAYLDARQNERSKNTQLQYEIRHELNLKRLSDSLYRREWKPSPPIVFVITEPTVREVFAPQFVDRVVSHVLFSILSPLFERTFIHDSYSCRTGKGTLFGIGRFEHHIRSITDNYRYAAYILNVDISGYFMSINKYILYDMMCETMDRYKDRDCGCGKWEDNIDFDFIRYLLEAVLFRDPLEGCIYVGNPKLLSLVPPQKSLRHSPYGTGLTIGDVICQLMSNIYLNPYDHYVKRELKIKGYGRYVDDARLVHRDYDYLLECKELSARFLEDRLKLRMHPLKTTITSTDSPNFFLGACIEKHRRYVKNETVYTFRRKVAEYERAMLSGCTMDIIGILSNLNSYLGHFRHFKTKKMIGETFAGSPLMGLFSLSRNYSKLTIKKAAA